MRVIGLDLSLTAIGVAYPDGDTEVLCAPDRRRKRGEHRTYADNMARLDWLEAEIIDRITLARADLVVIEGYSRGSRNGREEAGELSGPLQLHCWRNGIPTVHVVGKKQPSPGVPPTLVKQFACNDRSADKPKMAVTASRAGWTGESHDAADAWWLRQMGLYAACRQAAPIGELHDVPHTAYRDEAVAKVIWPVLSERVAS